MSEAFLGFKRPKSSRTEDCEVQRASRIVNLEECLFRLAIFTARGLFASNIIRRDGYELAAHPAQRRGGQMFADL